MRLSLGHLYEYDAPYNPFYIYVCFNGLVHIVNGLILYMAIFYTFWLK